MLQINARVFENWRDVLRISAVLGMLWVSSTAWLLSQASASAKTSNKVFEQAAAAARERGDIDASIKLYDRALEHEPSWQEGWWYEGSLHYDQNQYPAAVRAFRKLVQLNSKLDDAWAMLGLSEYECQDYADSFKDLQKAAADSAALEDSLRKVVDYHRALLLNVHGDSDAAYMVLSSLFLGGVHSEDLQVALGLSLLRVPVYPPQLDPTRDALIHDAGNIAAFMTQKQFDKAEVAFEDLLKQYPNVPYIHYAFGAMLASNGRDHDAEEQFRAETQVNPDSALPYMEWSFVESKAKHYSDAVDLARKAVDRSENSFMAHYLLGNGLLMNGDAAGARPELEAAQKLAPEVPDIRYSLSRVYARLGEPALAKQEQTEFIALQRKNALDRVKLRRLYPSAQSITGVRPTTN